MTTDSNTLPAIPARGDTVGPTPKSKRDGPPATGTTGITRRLNEQVSFVIQHKVKPDHHDEYEVWLRKTIAEAAKFKGHMGAQIARPAKGGDNYEISVRFATRADADRWIESETRKALIREVEPHIQEPETLKISSGIDYWFTSVTEGGVPPPRWKQWLTTVSVIWPLSILMPMALEYLFRAVPVLGTFGIRHLISAMIMVGLLVYVIMPPYTRAIAKWLSK